MYNPLKVDEEEYDKYIKWALGDLMEMVQLCKQNGITVLVMNYPVADPPRSKNLLPWARYISEAIREKALAEELDFLDITRVFDQLGPNKSQYQHTDYEDDHCNARGYAFIAERLYEHIINKGYLKTSHEQ
jgi:lysophospholipase L1-like esterase